VVDGGNSTLKLLTELKHCGGFAGDADSAIEMIASVVRMVIDRRRRSDTSIQHRVLLVVDELANLLMVLDNQASKRMQTDLATIAAEGRKFGIHLLVGTQKPLAEVTGNLTKANMSQSAGLPFALSHSARSWSICEGSGSSGSGSTRNMADLPRVTSSGTDLAASRWLMWLMRVPPTACPPNCKRPP
jgi:hypothetical protein